jgi:hypothetical protein
MLSTAGRFGRRLETDHVEKPDLIWADWKHGRLAYDTGHQLADAPGEEGLLDAFLRLVEATDGEIFRFAKKYGVLNVNAFNDPGVHWESFTDWRAIARQIRATLKIATFVRRKKPVSAELWEQVPGWTDMTRLFAWQRRLSAAEIQRRAELLQLEDVVNYWLVEWASVRPCFTWCSRVVGLGFTNLDNTTAGRGLTLSGALALQVALAVSGAQTLAICSGCTLPYIRAGRKPATGRDNYCEPCRKSGVPMRAARARYRLAERHSKRKGRTS